MRLLLTGGSGILGSAIRAHINPAHISLLSPSIEEMDITDSRQVNAIFDRFQPEAVLHCAAYTKVDEAEHDEALCGTVNVEGTQNVAQACKACGAYLLSISSDYVFDGEKETEYLPEDEKKPLSVYGRSKAASEDIVLSASQKNAVVRTSWLFGLGGRNFVDAILEKARNNREINVVADQVGSPTYADDLAKLLLQILQIRPFGVLQVTNEGFCSRAEFARKVIQEAGLNCTVREVLSEEYPAAAKRPHNSRMSRKCMDSWNLPRLPSWTDAVHRYIGIIGRGKKTVLVTGAGGYIGRHAVSALCDAGAEVTAVDIRTDGIDPRAKAMTYDIFNGSETIYTELGSPDACLHMAWKDGFIHKSDAHMELLSSHYKFLRNMINGGLKQLAVMGTMHEVGYWEGVIDENTPCKPISMYGVAKDALRRSAFLMAGNKDVCLQWLRAYYIYGDDKRAVSIFGKLMQAAEDGKETFPFTSGKNKYDFIHVDDLSRQIAAAVMQTRVAGIINCCTGEPMSLAEKVERFIREHGYTIKLDYGAYPDRPYDSPGVWGDAAKIRRIMEGAC